jgi:hypothetical protein
MSADDVRFESEGCGPAASGAWTIAAFPRLVAESVISSVEIPQRSIRDMLSLFGQTAWARLPRWSLLVEPTPRGVDAGAPGKAGLAPEA